MILQMVKNECVRLGGLLHIQGNYKILQLKVERNAVILDDPPCFE
jgi:hypothetical protein